MKTLNLRFILLTGLFLLTGTLTASAQEEQSRDKSVYLELLGPSMMVGINYDARFKEGSPWGYRTGLGFGYSESNWFFGDATSTRVYSIPLEVNYLIGKRKSKLELGVGVNVGLYNDHYRVTQYEAPSNPSGSYVTKTVSFSENKVSAFGYTDVGYRYTSTRGFQFRVGLTTALTLDKTRQSAHTVMAAPYISFGKAF